jgi:hypothetical protein
MAVCSNPWKSPKGSRACSAHDSLTAGWRTGRSTNFAERSLWNVGAAFVGMRVAAKQSPTSRARLEELMNEIDTNKPWHRSLFKIIPLRNPAADLIRPFTKWFFDTLKNIITATM